MLHPAVRFWSAVVQCRQCLRHLLSRCMPGFLLCLLSAGSFGATLSYTLSGEAQGTGGISICAAANTPVFGYAAAGIDTDQEVTANLTQVLSGSNNQTHRFDIPADTYAYLAYPASMGLVTMVDPGFAPSGGLDGASWPLGQLGSEYGPIVVTRMIDGVAREWYLYRSDFPWGGFTQLDLSFQNPGLTQACDMQGNNCYPLQPPVYGFAAEGVDTDQEIIDNLTSTLANSQNQQLQWVVPEGAYVYMAYPRELGLATFNVAMRTGWDGAGWVEDVSMDTLGPITVRRTVDGVSADWNLYRTDFPIGGIQEYVIHFDNLSTEPLCAAVLLPPEQQPSPTVSASPVWAEGPEGIVTGTELAELALQDVQVAPLDGTQEFVFTALDLNFGYFTHPASLGVATLQDLASGFAGGWDGATTPVGAFPDDRGPLLIFRRINGTLESWYLYRMDFNLNGPYRFRVWYGGASQPSDGSPYISGITVPQWSSDRPDLVSMDALGQLQFAEVAEDIPVSVTTQFNGVTDTQTILLKAVLSAPDQEAPVVTPPANITVAAVDASGVVATESVIAAFLAAATTTDNVDGFLIPSHDAPDIFPLGETAVTFSATDAAGNTGTSRATVSVYDAVLDSDADGQIDFFDTDDDNDGLPDEWERANSFNPLDSTDASLDGDNDGVSNYEEYLAGTNPTRKDTDNDGASDGDERAEGTDPLDGNSIPSWMMPSKGGWRFMLEERP